MWTGSRKPDACAFCALDKSSATRLFICESPSTCTGCMHDTAGLHRSAGTDFALGADLSDGNDALWEDSSAGRAIVVEEEPAFSANKSDSHASADSTRLETAGTDERRLEHLGVFERGSLNLAPVGLGASLPRVGKSPGCQRLSASAFCRTACVPQAIAAVLLTALEASVARKIFLGP